MMQQSNSLGRIGLLFFVFCSIALASVCEANEKPPAWPTFVDQFIAGYFEQQPTFAAEAGRHEYDGRLPDWSPQGLRNTERWLEAQRMLALAYPDQALTPEQRFERDYLLATVTKELFWRQVVRRPYKSPQFYAGALDPNLYISRPYAPPAERMRAFIVYASNVPQAAAQIRANLELPLPRTYIDIGKTVFGGLAKFYEAEAKGAFAEVADPTLQREFADKVGPAAQALRELADWLEQQRPTATDAFALGPEKFSRMLADTEAVELPLPKLEQMGRADLQRNLHALKQACRRFAPQATTAACVAQAEAHKPPAGPVAAAGEQLKQLKAFVAERQLLTIPSDDEANVAPSPPYARWNLAYIDIPGPYEHGLPSVYYVAPPDPAWSAAEQAAYLPGQANLLFVSAHEVWPGHFLQFLHAHRAGSKFGQLFGSYAFSEGWAHYAEELMWEAGLNDGDPETHIGQLVNALLRDVRFLAAIGLHTQGWSLEQAEQMFREQAFRDPGNARQQAARGTFDPAYLNYTLGKLLIRQLRDDWCAQRGRRAAWRQFHDAFLSYGSPPIPLVAKAMLAGRD
ncbi:hypothetical protein A1356_21180 [Methylomonas koyamae]|uniref:DUF885 domain-containing protein n=2 Tax=Methylomonas koyamae TaxID=702114 RepID=A0AA91D8G5_9GAMM|nr:hypothetical protein A1356_21180 [Methylomonas koyamae]